MTNEDVIMICKNALLPYDGGKEALEKVKKALERSNKLIQFNEANKAYYSDEFIKGFNCGAKRQYERCNNG